MSAAESVSAHRILVIDDQAAIHDDFRKILLEAMNKELAAEEAMLLGESSPAIVRPRFDLDCALQGQAGVELATRARAEGRPYQVAFVDMRMPPGWDGLQTIEALWAIDPHVQVVICSAYAENDWHDLLTRLGCSDRLIVLKKPFEPIEVLQCASALGRKWQNEQTLHRQVEELERVVAARTQGLEAANRQLSHLATHDVLTGLPNRVILNDRLERAIAHAARDSRRFALLLLDLDRFKLINDSLGHRAGDELLKEATRRLRKLVREVDTFVRLGGDEFVILMSGVDAEEQAQTLARRVLEALQPAVRILGEDVYTSASVGIAFYPADGRSAELLLAHADAAMYGAKQSGRGTFQCFAAATSAPTRDRVRLEADLHTALEAGQLELHYQPKVDTESGKVRSAEALIRWRHPERGLLLPGEFIAVAEGCGLLDSIGEWVIREACRQASEWRRRGYALRVAVNVSPPQFRLGSLLEVIAAALEAAALEARFLEVELTETAVMSNPEESIAILEALSRMGVLVSVDDFGTGYSSMSYLRRFPIDKLKIDGSFVKDLATSSEDACIVRAMVSLAHSLNLKVVAEGVETAEQLDCLRQLGCDQYQGFHYSAALPPAQLTELLDGGLARAAQGPDSDPSFTQSRLARPAVSR